MHYCLYKWRLKLRRCKSYDKISNRPIDERKRIILTNRFFIDIIARGLYFMIQFDKL